MKMFVMQCDPAPARPAARPRRAAFFRLAGGCRRAAGLPAGLALAAADARAQLQAFVDQVQAATGRFQPGCAPRRSGGRRPEAQRGVLAFQRPGKFRWEVQKPYPQLIVSDGRRVYQYDPDLEQVTEREAGQAIGASPAALLFGSGSLEDAFTLQAQPDRDGVRL